MSGIKVINVFGAPSSGKSTFSAGLFYELRKRKITAELITEFAKDCVYEERLFILKNQMLILGEQYHRLWRVVEYFKKNDISGYIINDTPFLVSLIYHPEPSETFEKFIVEEYKKFEKNCEMINVFLPILKEFKEDKGRVHNFEQSKQIEKAMIKMLVRNNFDFKILFQDTTEERVNEIIEILSLKFSKEETNDKN